MEKWPCEILWITTAWVRLVLFQLMQQVGKRCMHVIHGSYITVGIWIHETLTAAVLYLTTKPVTFSEPQSPSIDAFELHKICRFTDFLGPVKLWNVWSGSKDIVLYACILDASATCCGKIVAAYHTEPRRFPTRPLRKISRYATYLSAGLDSMSSAKYHSLW